MIKSLYGKFAVLLIVVFSITGLSFSILTLFISKDYLQQINQQAHRDLAKNILHQRHLVDNNKIDDKALKETFHHYMTVNPNLEFYLLDTQGKILTYSAEPGQVKRLKVNLKPFEEQLADDNSQIVKGDDPRNLNGKKYFSVAAFPNRKNPQGYLYIILQSQAIERIYQDLADIELFNLSLYSLIGSLIIGLILGLSLFYRPAQRLKNLSQSMLHFKKTGFTEQYSLPTKSFSKNVDEITLLDQSFAEMTEHITQQMLQLKKQDQLRRSMIANISHDLRTPLASIFGYLEVLYLKGDELAIEQRQQYLHTALHSSKQLSGLIEDLFELAKLEASETPPHIESFSIAELILDVMDKFRLQAEQKNISLKINCDKDTPFVYADISMIERALNNLIGNALEHNDEGGEVTILVEKKTENLNIIVKDTGKGIAPEHLKQIYERFYQVNNQHREGKHAGLGLAITKRIVELHGQIIDVQSKIGIGTAFSFSLPTSNIY